MGRTHRGIFIGLSALALALPASDARADERWEFDPTTGYWLQVEAPDEAPADARPDADRARRRSARDDRSEDDRREDAPHEEGRFEGELEQGRAGRDALAANPRPPVRSGGAIAGGIVLTSFGALFAGLGGLALLYNSATRAEPDEYAAPVAVTALGLGAVAGGITLMVWGGRRDAPSYGLQVAPARVQVGGTF